MEKHVFILLSLFGVLCSGCSNNKSPDNLGNYSYIEKQDDSEPKTQEEVDPKTPNESKNEEFVVVYNEKEDSMEGLDPNDFSNLFNALIGPKDKYTVYGQQYFNDSAKEYYKINYGEDLPVSYQKDFTNTGSDDFTLYKLTEEYITNHEFTRISECKFETRNAEAIRDLLYIVCPSFKNDGYYMTFSKAIIETKGEFLDGIRIYANSTQIGKLLDPYKNTEYKNWYLMFAECEFPKIYRYVIEVE